MKRGVFWLPLLTLILIELVRTVLVDRFYFHATAIHEPFRLLVFKHDSLIIGCAVLLQLVGWSVSSRLLSTMLRLMVWLILLLCMADLFVFAQFSVRISMDNIILLGSEGNTIVNIVNSFSSDLKNISVTLAMALTILSLTAVWPAPSPLMPRSTKFGSLAGLMVIGVSQVPDQTTYVNDWAYLNLFEIQVMNGVLTPYSDSLVAASQRWSEKHDEARQCVPGINSRRNVILVFLESLSSRQSRYISGLHDWTPHIDAIARKNTVWQNFYANGSNTAYGYVATLTGHDPLTAINARQYARWMNSADALPFRLKQYGYKSVFLTSGDLGFLNTGRWLNSIGFDYIEGHDAPFYNGMERFNFHAAPDGALYDRSLQWIKGESSQFFLVLKTVSTHLPYMNPVTREKSGKAAFRYADETFDKFVEELYAQGYFSRGGLLLLTGDHREMVVLDQDEVQRYGASANARVPLVMVGDGLNLPKQITGPYQQTDIPPSIEYLVGTRACFTERQRNLFLPEKLEPSRCILHMRDDRKDIVDAFCDQQFEKIRLDGDATKIVGGVISEDDALIQDINAERIGWFLRRKLDGSVIRALPGE